MKILVHPRSKNPYQRLLYSALEERHKDVDGTYFDSKFFNEHMYTWGILTFSIRLIKFRLRGYKIFHLHWFTTFSIPTNNKLIQFFFLTHLLISLFFIKILGFKLIWTVHEVLPHEKQYINDIWVRRLLSRLCASKIVHSKLTIEEMKKYRLDTKNTYVIPHGNYIGAYPNTMKRNEARKALGISENDFAFLFFGRVEKYKGVKYLLESFSKLKYPNKKLIIAGKCVDPKLVRMLSAYKKSSDITIVDHFIPDSDIQLYFNAADISCYQFEKVTTSGSVILSLSYGKPIICPRIGDLQDLPHNIGFYYESHDTDGLYNSLKTAIASREKLTAMGQNASTYARSLSWDNVSDLTHEVYERVLTKT